MNYRHYYCTPKLTFKGDGYFGYVSGIKNAKMIEAATIDEFEEEFHRYVDEYLREREERKAAGKRKTLIWVSALAVIIIALIATCPDKQKHTEALQELTASLINDVVGNYDADGYELIGAYIGNRILDAFIDDNLYVDNYFLFSVGKMTYEGEENPVSFGIFNHVFSKSREQFKKEAKENDEFNKAMDGLLNKTR